MRYSNINCSHPHCKHSPGHHRTTCKPGPVCRYKCNLQRDGNRHSINVPVAKRRRKHCRSHQCFLYNQQYNACRCSQLYCSYHRNLRQPHIECCNPDGEHSSGHYRSACCCNAMHRYFGHIYCNGNRNRTNLPVEEKYGEYCRCNQCQSYTEQHISRRCSQL